MESPSLSNGTRIRLQIVIASESTDGEVRDLRKFLHITQRENDISSLITEVNDKFKSLYPSERYHHTPALSFAVMCCVGVLTIDRLRY